MITCVVLALMAGFRDIHRWPDTIGYVMSFTDYTHPLSEWSA